MVPQYNHNLLTSMTLWLANRLENTGQCYINVTGLLYAQTSSSTTDIVYSSPYKGWIYDSCVNGAVIPSGFFNSSGQFLTTDSGILIDFIDGCVFSPQNWGPTLSGVYSRKEVNVYLSSLQESDYVLEQVYGENPNMSYVLTGFQGRALAAPLVMLTNSQGHNAPFALGGMDNTKNTVRAFIITNSNYLQEGVESLCRDAAHSFIPLGSYTDTPIAISGNLKGADYNYCTGFAATYGCANGIWIENVYEVKLNEKANKNPTFYLSLLEFDVSNIRMPRG